MSATAVHHCTCAACRSSEPHPDQALHQQINLFLSRLGEQQRRWFAALEATRLGYGGATRLAAITGIDRHTIARGQRELAAGLTGRPHEQVRSPGAGRPARDIQDPALKPALAALLAVHAPLQARLNAALWHCRSCPMIVVAASLVTTWDKAASQSP